MPYIKQKDIPFISLSRTVLGYYPRMNQLSEVLGCDVRTAKSKLEHPEKFTMGDVRSLCLKGHIPIDELRGAMKW